MAYSVKTLEEALKRIDKLEQDLTHAQSKIVALKEGDPKTNTALLPSDVGHSTKADILALELTNGLSPHEVARAHKWSQTDLEKAISLLSERTSGYTQISGQMAMTHYASAVQHKVSSLRHLQNNYETGPHESASISETYLLQPQNPLDPVPIDPDRPTTRTVNKSTQAHHGVSTSEYLKAIQQEADLLAKYIEIGQRLGVIHQVTHEISPTIVHPTQINVEVIMGDLIREATRRQDIVVLKKIADGDMKPDDATDYLEKLRQT